GGLTAFLFDGGEDEVNNTGRILANGFTGFFGLENFNNAGGVVDMRDGADNDIVLTTGNFNGGQGSRLGIDARLGSASGLGLSDLLLVGGNVGAPTGLLVNDLLAGQPGSYNPDGVVFASVGGNT